MFSSQASKILFFAVLWIGLSFLGSYLVAATLAGIAWGGGKSEPFPLILNILFFILFFPWTFTGLIFKPIVEAESFLGLEDIWINSTLAAKDALLMIAWGISSILVAYLVVWFILKYIKRA
jgi:hypothetical protein